MSALGRIVALLCLSGVFVASATADEDEPFVTQLRLPARDRAIDVFAWRSTNGVEASRADLERLSLVVPANIQGDRIALTDIPGLSYSEDEAASAIEIACTASCFTLQHVGRSRAERVDLQPSASTGAYINYDVDAQWVQGGTVELSGLAEAAAFGRFGLFETSWLRDNSAGLVRLESRWTLDLPQQRLRLRAGDSSLSGAGGGVVQFAGVQIGRHFGLEPSLITYPTPMLSGEAARASTVELYVDGALRAREQVQAGPFAFDGAPLVTGAGEAEIVVTDLLGRSQTITRPFLVSTTLLRKGLTDWSVAAGVERRDFGQASTRYGQAFASARFRAGVHDALTLEAAIDATQHGAVFQGGATMAHPAFGQVRIARAEAQMGGLTEASWQRDFGGWSLGVQGERADRGFSAPGRDATQGYNSVAANFAVDFGRVGAAAFTAASFDETGELPQRVVSFSYTPGFAPGWTARITQTQGEVRDVAFSLNATFSFGEDVSSSFAVDTGRRGVRYRATSQRAADALGNFGWRARSTAGRDQRLEFAGSREGRLGDTLVQAVRTPGDTGVRATHAGSVGWIEGQRFAGRPIHGAFALVDAGAPGVGISRDRLSIGATGADGRVLAVGLRPYDTNVVAISANDLPLDRAPSQTAIAVAPREGAGVLLRFTDAAVTLREMHVLYAKGEPAPRGAMLLRARDSARFPIGTDGRVVLLGAEPGDQMQLSDDLRCFAVVSADTGADLTLHCDAA